MVLGRVQSLQGFQMLEKMEQFFLLCCADRNSWPAGLEHGSLILLTVLGFFSSIIFAVIGSVWSLGYCHLEGMDSNSSESSSFL